jgi:porin
VRLSVKPNETLTLRAAILDGVPGDPARLKRTTVKLGKGDGSLLVAEADKSIGNWRLIAGHWRYTGRFEDRLASALSASAIMKSGNSGYYLRGEGKIAGGDTSRTANAFSGSVQPVIGLTKTANSQALGLQSIAPLPVERTT